MQVGERVFPLADPIHPSEQGPPRRPSQLFLNKDPSVSLSPFPLVLEAGTGPAGSWAGPAAWP